MPRRRLVISLAVSTPPEFARLLIAIFPLLIADAQLLRDHRGNGPSLSARIITRLITRPI
jgi:hypothetical protein